MALDRERLLEHLQRDLAGMVADLDSADLESPVPSCPGWNVADLVAHTGSVHRWATEVVRTSQAADRPAPPEPGELPEWFAAGTGPLLTVLRAAVPGTPCWTFGPPPQLVDFWWRRQALETAVHRWDLLDAITSTASAGIPADLAADGVDEVAELIYPRQVRLGRIEPLAEPVDVVCLETGRGVRLGEPDGPPAATVSGLASDLLLLLWRRLSVDSERFQVEGDAHAVRGMLATAITP